MDVMAALLRDARFPLRFAAAGLVVVTDEETCCLGKRKRRPGLTFRAGTGTLMFRAERGLDI